MARRLAAPARSGPPVAPDADHGRGPDRAGRVAMLVAAKRAQPVRRSRRARPGSGARRARRCGSATSRSGGRIAIGLGGIVVLLGVLFAIFTVFTALSIFGVFLGTAAPIIALSVMSGFENDLKTKIRSTKADVVIERRDDRPFTDWKAVEAKLAGPARHRGVDGLRRGRGDREARDQRRRHGHHPARHRCRARAARARDRTHDEGREDQPPRAPGGDPDRHLPGGGDRLDRIARRARSRRGCCPGSCWARSCTSTSCACSSAARSTSPARCAASARSGRCPS